jgi:hypothetical protein
MHTVACSYIILFGATIVATVPNAFVFFKTAAVFFQTAAVFSKTAAVFFQTAAVFFQTAAVFFKAAAVFSNQCFSLPVATRVAPKRVL